MLESPKPQSIRRCTLTSLNETPVCTPVSDSLAAYPPYIELVSVDPHVHPRDDEKSRDGRMGFVVEQCAKVHSWVLGVGNVPGLTTSGALWSYKNRFQKCIPSESELSFGVARLLNNESNLDDFREGRVPRDGVYAYDAVKIFPPGVSNDGGIILSDWRRGYLFFRYCAENGIPVIFHLEIARRANGKKIQMRNREWEAAKQWVMPLRAEFPDLIIHIYHASDRRTIEWVMGEYEKGRPTSCGICPQYWKLIFEDLFEGPHFVGQKWCMPCFKGYKDIEVVRFAMLSGLPCFVFETDFATHNNDATQEKGVKCTAHGDVCGGLTILPEDAMSLVIDAFIEAGKPEAIQPFVFDNAVRIFKPQIRRPKVTRFQRRDRVVEKKVPRPTRNGTHTYYPFGGGSTNHWSVVS